MSASAIVFAYHDVGVRCLQVLLEAGVRIPLVLTHADDPAEEIWFSSVAALAMEQGIRTLTPDDPNTSGVLDDLRALAPDFIFSFYYRRMLAPATLATARRGAYNMHGSLLPKYRGRAPVNWAVLHGETQTGATLHEMVAKPDAGRIVDQQAVPIGPDETAVEVFRKVTAAAETVLRRSLPLLIEDRASLRAQDFSQGSYFGGRRPEDGRIDWHRSSVDIHNLVRAVAPPYPGAFTDVAGLRLQVLRTRRHGPHPDRALAARGPVLLASPSEDFVTALCGDGETLALVDLSLDGRPLTVRDFVARFGSGPIHIS